jgi:hypothetical protein
MERARVVARSAFLCGLVGAALAGPAFGDSVVVPAAADTTLIESATGTLGNGAGPAFFVGRTSQAVGPRRRGLIRFDVAAALPTGVIVTRAELRLVLTPSNPEPRLIGVHRVGSDWGEGDSSSGGGSGAPATPGDATWLHTFYDTDFWASPGGDFVGQASAELEVSDAAAAIWASTPATIADVQTWLDSPDQNHGWVLIGDEDSPTTAKRFASREAEDPAQAPQLVVEYEAPCDATALDGAAHALCNVYCEVLDCDEPAHARSPRACEELGQSFSGQAGGASLPCER